MELHGRVATRSKETLFSKPGSLADAAWASPVPRNGLGVGADMGLADRGAGWRLLASQLRGWLETSMLMTRML